MDETALALSRREAQLLHAHLARHLARLQLECPDVERSTRAEEVDVLRHVQERLRGVLTDMEIEPDVV